MKEKVLALPVVLFVIFFLFTGCEIFEPQTLPIGVVIVSDVSGSMSGGTAMADQKEGLKAFISYFDLLQDKVGLVKFESYVSVVLPFGPVNRDENNSGTLDIIEAIDTLSAWGGTALWDGSMKGLEIGDANNHSGISMGVLVFTDGVDNASRSTEDQVIQEAKRVGLPIFIVGLDPRPSYYYDPEPLRRVAQATGGLFYDTPDSAELKEIYLELFRQIQKRAEVTTYL